VLWADKGQKLLTCSGDTTIGLWDIEKTSRISSFLGHNLSAKCVKEVINNCTYVSGGRDGKICFFDTRQNPGKGCFANIKIAASVLLYTNTVFTGGIVNDVRGRCSIGTSLI
jgi:WD40 repeat protein